MIRIASAVGINYTNVHDRCSTYTSTKRSTRPGLNCGDTMSHVIRFRIPLTCTNCGSLNDARAIRLYTASFAQDFVDTDAEPGDVLDLEIIDFEDGYFTLRRPEADELTAIALEVWGCRVCLRTQAARLHFEREDPTHYRFVDARVAPLSGAVLDEANFISRSLEELAPNPGDDAARVREILNRFEQKPSDRS